MNGSVKEFEDIMREIVEKQKKTKAFLNSMNIEPLGLRCLRCGVPLIGHEMGLYAGLCQDCNGQKGAFL